MGGNIWVESEEGRGSQFHFTIRAGFPQSKGHSQTVEVPELAGVAILVVEDHVTGRRILRETLVRWGLRAVAVPDVAQALAALRQAKDAGTPFSLVLADIRLPDADGFTLIEKINRPPDTGIASVLMFTPGHKPLVAANSALPRILPSLSANRNYTKLCAWRMAKPSRAAPRVLPRSARRPPISGLPGHCASCSPKTIPSTSE
jgi:CheY-like chemotaxis protein